MFIPYHFKPYRNVCIIVPASGKDFACDKEYKNTISLPISITYVEPV